LDTITTTTAERRLGGALEPVIGGVYFSPEAHENYVALGFDPSPGELNGVPMPELVSYFTSRGSVMGQVSGNVVASAFGVFKPEVVAPAVSRGWELTDAPSVCSARDEGALGQLERILGPEPDGLARVSELLATATEPLHTAGRPLAAGVRALPALDHPLGAVFRNGDLLRECRGDSHTLAWVHAGLDATEISLLTELYWGLPLRSYSRTRGWNTEDFDAAEDRLRSRGLLTSGGDFTSKGRDLREGIEAATDEQMQPAIAALGPAVEELVDLLANWAKQIRDANGYPDSGPHELAAAATSPSSSSS